MRRLHYVGFAIAAGLTSGLMLGLSGCSPKTSDVWPPGNSGPKVLTSFGPYQCFAQNVAGDDAVVKVVLTTEGAHHGGDPTPLHLKLAASANLMFFNGLGLDDKIVVKIKSAASNPHLVTVALGDKIDKKCLLEGECHHEHGHEHGEEHEHGIDMHIWLSPKNAIIAVAAIRDELKKADPAHAAGYDSRAAAYIVKLEQLEKYGKDLLKDKKDLKILTHHDSLQYFARDFGLNIVSNIQTGEVEPGSKDLNNIVQQATKNKVGVIAVEPQFIRNSAASVIKAELKKAGIDAVFVEVDTLETADESELNVGYYERKMRQNLENLAKALQ